MNKTSKAFQDGLTLVSLWGFLVIALNSFTTFDLSQLQTSVLMIVIGGALMLEGKVLTIKKWGFDGIKGSEVPYLMTIIVGIFSIVVGILALPTINVTNPQLQTLTGIVAIFSFIFIAIQRWII